MRGLRYVRRCLRPDWALLGRRVGALLLACLCLLGAARAEDQVDLQLVLAVDASGSVNTQRFEMQQRGYAAAFRHPRVINAIRSGRAQGIAVTMVQWTGPAMQVQVVPWTVVRDESTARAFAAAIEAATRRLFGGGTSLSGAIDHAAGLFDVSPFRSGRRVIDISGDGHNNRGRAAREARDQAVAQGITINGLPILELEPFLDEHYRSEVIGGPNAFIVVAQSYEEFADAILRKLVTEIAVAPRVRVALRRRPAMTSP